MDLSRGAGCSAADTASLGSGAPFGALARIRTLQGSVTVIRGDGQSVRIDVGSNLYHGDLIATDPDGQVGITFGDGGAIHLPPNSRLQLPKSEGDPRESAEPPAIKLLQGSLAFLGGKQLTRAGPSIDTPLATIRSDAQGGAIVTLTLVGLTIALLKKAHAAGNEPFLLDDLIKYKDLQHGALLITPKGGATRSVVLDDPEITIVVGPPESGYNIQQVVNSAAEMAMLLAVSADVYAAYLLGQADPFTTGSLQRAETHLFFPDQPTIQFASLPLNLLPPLPDDPVNQPTNFTTGGGDNAPPQTPTLVLTPSTLVLSQDETPGQGTADPFPIPLAGIAGIGTIMDLGRTEDGNPFVSTAGSVFTGTLVITVEASSEGVDSGLDVTGGGSIFLFTETTAGGDQVAVGREGGAGGDIAFIIYITPDGQTLWVQQTLPIDHGDDNNDHDSVLTIMDSALLVRATLTEGATTLTQTLMVGNQVEFKDDGPIALDDAAQVQAQSALATVNALFILDTSGSMGIGNPSRLDLAKAAILEFASQANVLSIRVLPFAGSAAQPSEWFDVTTPEGIQELADFLNLLSADGGTNYQDAIHDAQETWEAPPKDSDLTSIYFVSDGAPNSPLTPEQKAAWEAFLANPDNGIDNAYAVGIGTGVDDDDLQDVAYPDDANNVIIIASASDLSATLQATTLTGMVSGNVIDNLTADTADDDSFGTDGPGFIKTLRYDSDGDGVLENSDNLYSFDGANIYLNGVLHAANTHEITFVTGFDGKLKFDFLTGAWTYTTPKSFTAQFVEHFSYTIVDGDGDESEPAALDVTVLPPPPPTYSLAGAPDVIEGDPLIFTLTLSHASAEDIVFRLATVDGTATGGDDFETSGFRYSTDNGTTWLDAGGAGDEVTIPAGKTSVLIEVDTFDDQLDESEKESMQLVVDEIVSGTVAADGNDASETGLIGDREHAAFIINAPSTINYWTASPIQTSVTYVNRISFQDANASAGIVVVTFKILNGGGDFLAVDGGGVAVGGSGTTTMTLTGTIADINAFIHGNNVQFDPPGAAPANRIFSVTIDDGNGGATSTNITLHHQSLENLNSSGSANEVMAGWNFNDVDVNLGGGNDTIVTSWSHGPSGSDVRYLGGDGHDTITLVFTPQQLEQILTNAVVRGWLDGFLEGTTLNLDLGDTAWNAEVLGFEDANLALAAGPLGYAVYAPANSIVGIPNSTLPSNGDDYLEGTGAGDNVDGQGGNDIILGLGGDDVLNGGAGSDLILGGAGNDTIDGGEGDDVLSGGPGADTFVAGLNSGLDTIVDYSFAEGDMLDLSALLDANFGVVSSDINHFVQLTQTGSDINVLVDPTGTGNFGTQVFVLAGIGTASGNDPVKIYLENAEHTMTV